MQKPFMHRKKKYGSLPMGKPNDHRRINKNHATSRSSPTQDERLELTKEGRDSKIQKWSAIFNGREKINLLFMRAGIRPWL